MTELEEAELTDGQGHALSTHKTQQSYEGYAKRMLSATRKRHAHRLAEQNEPGIPFGMRRRKAFGIAPQNKERFLRNINWLGREGSNLRMAESKSA
jgi:hypothetical protein